MALEMTQAINISAKNLSRSFGTKQAVANVSLQISAGEIYGLVGSDGAGKTTTLRLLVGALRPDSGQATICGHPLDREVEQARACLGYLSQRFSLYEDLTVLENIRFFAEVRGLTSKEWLPRCLEILEFVGLATFRDRRAGQLSGGMKQKLGLASALVTRPRVLLLDEPTTGVDPVTRQDFWQLIIRLVVGQAGAQEKVSVIITTPYMDEASRCNRVGFMRSGKIIAEDAPSALRSRYEGLIVELRGKPLPLLRQVAVQDEDVEDAHAFGSRLHLRVRPGRAAAAIARLEKAIPVVGGSLDSARQIPPVLEDVFIALSQGEGGRE